MKTISMTLAVLCFASPALAQPVNVAKVLADTRQHFRTVTKTYVYTEANDPNHTLGKAHYYISGGAFADRRVSRDTYEAAHWGAEAGGSIEVYATVDDAERRTRYLEAFQGNPILEPGAVKQVGCVVVRASKELSASQQKAVIAFLANEVR